MTWRVDVNARSEFWQEQVLGTSAGAVISVKKGDVVSIAADGTITYASELHGLRKKRSGPWGRPAKKLCETCYSPGARAGVILWRIGSEGQVHSAEKGQTTFTADRGGSLQFMVNDQKGAYGDNRGTFHVSVTIVRR
jgi:hypothetical protein